MKNENQKIEFYGPIHQLSVEQDEWLTKNQVPTLKLSEEMVKCGLTKIYDLTSCIERPSFYGDFVALFNDRQYIDWGITKEAIQQLAEDSVKNNINLIKP